jgi:hypothetical protein
MEHMEKLGVRGPAAKSLARRLHFLAVKHLNKVWALRTSLVHGTKHRRGHRGTGTTNTHADLGRVNRRVSFLEPDHRKRQRKGWFVMKLPSLHPWCSGGLTGGMGFWLAGHAHLSCLNLRQWIAIGVDIQSFNHVMGEGSACSHGMVLVRLCHSLVGPFDGCLHVA